MAKKAAQQSVEGTERAKRERIPIETKSDFQIGAQLERLFNRLPPAKACRILGMLQAQQQERYAVGLQGQSEGLQRQRGIFAVDAGRDLNDCMAGNSSP